MSKHRWFDEITAWANGKVIQWRTDLTEVWRDWTADSTPYFHQPGIEWRIKPKMCSLNGYEFPAPISEAPPEGATVWITDPSCSKLAVSLAWVDDSPRFNRWTRFERWLRHGRIHLSKEAAIAHARAEILAVGGTLEEDES